MADELWQLADGPFATAVRTFAGATYSQLAKNKLGATDNLFYSPVSIAMALAALRVGAKTNTSKQIDDVLGLSDADTQKLSHEIGTFLGVLDVRQTDEDGTETQTSPLRIANALAIQDTYQVQDAFINTLKKEFSSELSRVDFVHNTEAARVALNKWIAEKTAQRIKELLQQGSLDSMTRLVIANAVMFDGTWDKKFDAARTEDAKFKLLNDAANGMQVRMMTRDTTELLYWTNAPNPDWAEAPTPYADVVLVDVLSLPYKRAGGMFIHMIIILPRDHDGLPRLEALIASDPKALDTLLSTFNSNASRRDVNVRLPRFKFAEDLALASVLKQLGAVDMFDSRADFSAIAKSGAKELFVGAALHRAVVEVDEEGTRAAAATAFSMSLMCMPIPQPPVDFVVDHPCIFVLNEASLRIPLFVGRLAQPKFE